MLLAWIAPSLIPLRQWSIKLGEDHTEFEEFGLSKQQWLQERLGLSLLSGVPSHDTFGRLFSRLEAEAFATCFRSWTQEIQKQSQGQVIAVDGKTLRRSFDSASGKAAVHLVSAWASRNRLVLGQQAVDGKSNEMTAVPALLKMLDLRGCIVTVDALNTQKSIAEQVVEQGGDYLFALKKNHLWLYEDTKSHFDWALTRVAKGAALDTFLPVMQKARALAMGVAKTAPAGVWR